MSLLAELLLKAKKRPSQGDIPPSVERSLENRRRKSRNYIVVTALVLTFLAGLLTIRLGEGLKGLLEKRSAVHKAPSKNVEPLIAPQSVTVSPAVISAPEKTLVKDEGIEGSEVSEKTSEDRKAVLKDGVVKRSEIRIRPNKRSGLKVTGVTETKMESSGFSESKTPRLEEPAVTGGTQNNAIQLRWQALGCEERGDYGCAIKLYKEALKTEPANFRLYNHIAYLYIKLRLPDEAIEYARKARTLNPVYVPGMVNLSAALIMKGLYNEAEEVLLEAMTLEPSNRTVLYNMAVLYETNRRYDEAERFYERLLGLGDERAADALRRLRLKNPSQE